MAGMLAIRLAILEATPSRAHARKKAGPETLAESGSRQAAHRAARRSDVLRGGIGARSRFLQRKWLPKGPGSRNAPARRVGGPLRKLLICQADVDPSVGRSASRMATKSEGPTKKGVCKEHGLVDAIIVGPRLKCPLCGFFVHAADALPTSTEVPPQVGNLQDRFQRIELAEKAKAIRTRLESAPPPVREIIPEYPTTLRMIDEVLAEHTTASLAELERALGEVQDRATRLLGTPVLFAQISDLEAQHARLVQENAGLEARKQSLNTEVAMLAAQKKQLAEVLRGVEKRTGKSIGEIFELIRKDTDLQQSVAHLLQDQIQIQQEISVRSKDLGHLKWQIHYAQEHVRDLNATERGSLQSLAANLTLRDAQELEDLVWRRHMNEEERRAFERLNSAIAAVTQRAHKR